MSRFIIPVVLAFVFMPAGAKTETLRLATLDWEPYVGRQLENKGFTAEIVTESFKRAGYQVEIVFLPWGTAIEEARKGTCDGVFPEYYSGERARDFFYTSFFSQSRLAFYRRSSAAVTYRTLKDLSPYRIGVVTGSIISDEFDSAVFLNKVEAAGDEENLRKLVKGEVDLIVMDKLVARHLMTARVPEAAGRISAFDPPLAIHDLFVILPRSIPASAKRARQFTKALQSMEEDGTVKAIMSRSGLME